MNKKTKPYFRDLFDHMRNEHGLILLQSEMQEIVSICNTDLNAENEKLKIALKESIALICSGTEYEVEIERYREFVEKAKQLITDP